MKKILYILLLVSYQLNGQAPCIEGKAACNTTFSDLRFAVAKVSMPGFGTFTGFLVNHTSNDGRLLFLTTQFPFTATCSNDPGDMAAALSSTTFTFNDDFVSCSSTGATAVTTTGATLVATSGFIALLQLNNPPNLAQLTYLGWDISTSPESQACIFQTPNTNVRKGIVTASSQTTASVNIPCNGNFVEQSGFTQLIKVAAWDAAEPLIEGRGAPLIMDNLKVEGVYIIGNEDDCATGPSYFFDIAAAGSSFLSHLRSGSQTNSATIKRIPCQDNLPLSGPYSNSTLFSANNTITSTHVIGDGYSVQYTAGTSVTLNNGFVSGTDFVAQIGSCTPQVITIAAATKTDDIYNDNGRFQVREFVNPDIRLFPNLIPGNSPVFIESNHVIENVSLYITDINGKAIMTKQLIELQPNLPIKIDIPCVSSGLYFVQITAQNYLHTTKLIVQ